MFTPDELDEVLSLTEEITREEFGNIMQSANETDTKILDAWFLALDVDNHGSITKEDFAEFVNLMDKDLLYNEKLLFRAFDRGRDGRLDKGELKQFLDMNGEKPTTLAEVISLLLDITGDANGKMTFAQFICMVDDGRKIPEDTDPYDGKIESKCCLLV